MKRIFPAKTGMKFAEKFSGKPLSGTKTLKPEERDETKEVDLDRG